MVLKTVASLGPSGVNKYKRVGLDETKKIIGEIGNYGIRSKLKTEAAKTFGTNKFYLKDIAENISKTHGSSVASKFIEAIIKHEKIASAAKIDSEKPEKPAVPKYRQALDTNYQRYQYGGAKVGIAYKGNEKVIGIINPAAGISASGMAGKEKNGMESLGIKKNAAISAVKAPEKDLPSPIKLAA